MKQTLKPVAMVAAALLVCVTLFYVTPSADAATTRVLVINTGSAEPQVAFAGWDGNPAKVFDINGDGQKEIIAQNDNQYVYVFDSKTGKLLFQAKTTFPAGWGARTFNGPEVSVMTGDGKVRLIVGNSAAFITSYVFDPSQSTSTSFKFHKEWERRLSDCFSNPGMDAKPVLVDLDKDGSLEILAQTEESGVYALRSSGAIMWKQCIGGGNGEPATGDLNMDGFPDAIFASDGGVVAALNGRTGNWLWGYNILQSGFNLGSASIPAQPGIGQLDGVGGPEIVVGARDSHDPDNWDNDHALLLVLKSNGGLLWARQDPDGNPLTYTRPVVVDADKDGRNEIYWGDWNTIGHKPPWNEADAWKTTGPAHFYRYDHAGNLVWRQSLDTWWSNKDVPIADVDGDGVQEMLANGPSSAGHDGIWYLDTRTGAKETFIDVAPWTVSRAPVVADLWGTGSMQWVLEVGGPSSAGGPAILVYDTGVPYNAAWPHPPYPAQPGGPSPTTTTAPPGTTFSATFTIKAPNAWWQEVFVEPDEARTMTRVEVSINDGAWRSMELRSWGAWTSSYNTPAGTKVEFRATDESTATSTSEPFTWMDGTLSKRSVGSTPTTSQPPPTTSTPPPTTSTPPPTTSTSLPTTTPPVGTFSATYRLGGGINEWWVEVFVDTSQSLRSVETQINGGPWTPLELKSWGAWAKSLNAPTGSSVQFRATSTLGATNHSQTYRWLAPEGGEFQATFAPQAVGNDWWVEVRVTSADPITAVHASVNGGSWIALAKQSWGSWAKSFFVADGSSVRFRATNDQGETLVSDPVIWT